MKGLCCTLYIGLALCVKLDERTYNGKEKDKLLKF